MTYQRVKKRTAVFGWLCFALSMLCIQAPSANADAAAGKKIFDTQNCGSCHQMSGPTDPVAVAERAKIKGPPLWFAGSKFKKGWLLAWLAKPVPITRVKYGSLTKGTNEHPSLPPAEAEEVGTYLMSLTDSTVKPGTIDSKELNARTVFRAEALFAKKQVCFGCHEYPSKRGNIGGFTGPSLVGAGKRLQADWVYALLKNNIRYYPNGRMPTYGENAFNKYSDEELKLLSQYVAGL